MFGKRTRGRLRHANLFSCNRRQTGCCDGLADAPALLVGQCDRNRGSQLRKFSAQYFLSLAEDDVPTWAGGHATKYEYVLEIVEVRIVRNAIADVSANRLVQLDGNGIPGRHFLLQGDQPLRQTRAVRKLHACTYRYAVGGLLREVLRTTTIT